MKLNIIIKTLLLLFLTVCAPLLPAQQAVTEKQYPTSFTISKAAFDHLLSTKAKETIHSKNNKYLNKASVLVNSLNGDTRFMKLKLNFFSNAFMTVQVNGVYTTQVFIVTDDKSVFYKGQMDHGSVVMSQCNEGDIVSE